MTPENLELLARKAILEKQVCYPNWSPVVQIWSEHKFSANFPIPYTYVIQRFSRSEGCTGYIYSLCAYQILQYLERFKQEFDLR